METLVEYLSTHGRRSDLAKAIGVNPQLLSQWIHGVRPVPAARCPSIEAATNGRVRCEDLRPDVDWAYLRGTVAVDHDETPKTEATSEAA